MDLEKKWKDLLAEIHRGMTRAERPFDSIRLIGVSKKQPIEKIIRLLELGLSNFGENYVQEWKAKREQLDEKSITGSADIRWHFIGHLQTNKVKEVVGKVEYIHTLDSLKLAKKIAQQAQRLGINQKTLIEINLGNESQKAGIHPNELLENLQEMTRLSNISLNGLMAIPPPEENPEKMRPYFKRLKSLLDECNRSGFLEEPMKELSMGMSHDYQVALQEGATMIRIGTALFGPREQK